jgi:hypothetical protein
MHTMVIAEININFILTIRWRQSRCSAFYGSYGTYDACPFLPGLIDSGLRPIKRRVGVLISGSGSNLQALLEYTNDPSKCSAAEIVLVISNKPDVQGLERAQRFNVPTKVSAIVVFIKLHF